MKNRGAAPVHGASCRRRSITVTPDDEAGRWGAEANYDGRVTQIWGSKRKDAHQTKPSIVARAWPVGRAVVALVRGQGGWLWVRGSSGRWGGPRGGGCRAEGQQKEAIDSEPSSLTETGGDRAP
jgi:hypothetical protein